MNNVIVKVAPNGEGKTEWLLNQAKQEAGKGKKMIFFSTLDANRYIKFVERYHIDFKQACPAIFSNRIDTIEENSIVLIDNLFKQDLNTVSLSDLFNKGCKVYITICGNSDI